MTCCSAIAGLSGQQTGRDRAGAATTSATWTRSPIRSRLRAADRPLVRSRVGGGSRGAAREGQCVLLESDEPIEPRAGLARTAEFVRPAYVVDLAWLRATPWRERLAPSFDPPDRMARLQDLEAVSIRQRLGSGASGLLLACWLASRVGWEPRSALPGAGVPQAPS